MDTNWWNGAEWRPHFWNPPMQATISAYRVCASDSSQHVRTTCILQNFKLNTIKERKTGPHLLKISKYWLTKHFPSCKKVQLTHTHFLGQIHVDNPPVAFGAKQQHPKKLETTVTSVIELESYCIVENFHGSVRSDHFAEKTFAEH